MRASENSDSWGSSKRRCKATVNAQGKGERGTMGVPRADGDTTEDGTKRLLWWTEVNQKRCRMEEMCADELLKEI